MSNNNPNQPTRPGNGSQAPKETSRGVYNPIRVEAAGEAGWLGALESPVVRLFAGLLFATIFGVAWGRPQLAPVTILVLAACLLYRLGPDERKLAAAPLLLAAFRFALMLVAYTATDFDPRLRFKLGILPFAMTHGQALGADLAIPWIPAFLSVCLFYLPREGSVTLKIVAVEALIVILSSLLPGEGFVAILTMFQYTLFFAVGIGLLFDLKPGVRALFTSPHPNYVAPIRVQIPTPPPPRPAL